MTQHPPIPLTPLRLMGFAAPALPLAGLSIPLYVLLPTVYAETLGLGFATVGGLLLLARLWDAVSDPLIGLASDRFRLPFGRRRGWMLAGLPLTLLAVLCLFDPPGDAGALWLLGWSLALYLGWTMVVVPYGAWAAEASPEYHGRTRIFAWREGAVILGTIAASSLPAVIADPAAALAVLGWAMAVLLPVATILACRAMPEPPFEPLTPKSGGWRRVMGNQPFRVLIAAYLLNGIANGLAATLFLLFVTHRLEAPEMAGPLLAGYFIVGLVSVPLWLHLSRRFSKHGAWRFSLLWASAGFLATPFLGPGDWPWFAAVCVLSGLALGADMILPPAMQADVVEADRLAGGGSSRAGLYVALWGMATKLALALAVGLAFPLLEASGFRSDGSGPTLTLALLYGAAPILFKLAALVCLAGYRLDAVRLGQIRAFAGDTDPCAERPSSPLSSSPLPSLPGAAP